MPERIKVILGDGGAKTMKSSVSKAMYDAISQHAQVTVADAGRFVRQVTVAAFKYMGIDGKSEDIPSDALDEAIRAVVAAGTAFDETYEWGDLESPEVNRWVTVVGLRPEVQAQKMTWYERTIEQAIARGDEVLVFNSRNPRAHLTRWLGTVLDLRLELFTDCDPAVAARRKLLNEGVSDPTPEVLKAEELAIIKRRKMDIERPTDPYVPPQLDQLVRYESGSDPQAVIAQTWDVDPAEAPRPILFDTTNMTKEVMSRNVQELALFALGLSETK